VLLDTTATIETPERVRFQHRLAGPGPRAAAWLIDASVQLIVLSAVGAVLALVFSLTGLEGVGAGLWLVVLFVVEWFYGVFFETLLAGRTPGKLVLSLRTVRLDGSPGQFPDFLLRNLLRAADFLPVGFGLGVLCMVLDPRMRRLGDMVAGTVVIIEERTRVLGEVRIDPPVSEEERQALPARVDLTRAELDVIEALLRRRRSLSDARAEELAWLLGPQLSEATGIEAPSWERVLTLAYARATGKDRA
jgi:uncharacterized RDD family membrane protein YckC